MTLALRCALKLAFFAACRHDASAAARAGGCMFLTPSLALVPPPYCSRYRSGSEIVSFGSVVNDRRV